MVVPYVNGTIYACFCQLVLYIVRLTPFGPQLVLYIVRLTPFGPWSRCILSSSRSYCTIFAMAMQLSTQLSPFWPDHSKRLPLKWLMLFFMSFQSLADDFRP